MTSAHDKPLLVSATRAREILDIGETKFWAMVKAGKIKMAETGGRRLVVYSSLKAIANGSELGETSDLEG